MPTTMFLAGLLLQAAGAPPPQAPPVKPPTEWVVMLTTPVYQPNGAITAETVALPSTGAGLVHLFARRSMCNPGVSGATEPTDAVVGWRVASQIVTRSDRDVVVSLNWRRLWEEGRKTQSGPTATVELTLHPNDRIPLDHITNSKPTPECRAIGLGLHVELGQHTTQAPGRTPALPPGLPPGATPGGAKPVGAELWLLHTLPSDVQQAVHQTVRLSTDGGTFTFAPTSVATARGKINVELSGAIDRYRTPAGDEYLSLSLTRLVTGVGLPPEGVFATTGSVVPLPPTNDVLSFEMPGGGARGSGAIARSGGGTGAGGGGAVIGPPPETRITAAGAQAAQRGGGGGGRGGGRVIATANLAQVAALLEGHQFALRLRITPVPTN